VLFSHEPNKPFLVPDSCRVTERNCNSISADVTDATIENMLDSAIFIQFGSCFGLSDIAG
jgi:hypothetical protein